MGHQHHWCDEPPDGRLYFNKTFDERYGDEEDMATNAYLTSPEELQRLRCLLAKDPNFEHSPNWPKLTEWCPSCTKTRLVRVVLPAEEKVLEEEKITEVATKGIKEEVIVKEESSDASTQTPPQKSRRRGGQASRRRRMLAYQLKLTERLGLPLSRLLKETDAMSQRGKARRLEEESASPSLKGKRTKVEVKEDEKEEIVQKEEEKEERMRCNKEKASTGGSTLFTPRSFQSDVFPPSSHPFPQVLGVPFPSPYSTPPCIPYFSPPSCGQMPWPQLVMCGACQSWGTILPCAVLS